MAAQSTRDQQERSVTDNQVMMNRGTSAGSKNQDEATMENHSMLT